MNRKKIEENAECYAGEGGEGGMAYVSIPPVVEYDIRIALPDGREWVLQYRNYEGDIDTGANASVDLCLHAPSHVYNWKNVSMAPAPCWHGTRHVHIADQLCVIID